MSETRSDTFIKILKILESYKIEGERCVKYPTPLARVLIEMIYSETEPIIIPRVPPEDREIIGEGVTGEPVFPSDQVIHEYKPPPPLPPPKRSIREGKKPPQKPTKAMTKYRIVEIPQPDGGNKYRIEEFKLIPKQSFWFMKNPKDRTVEAWHELIIDTLPNPFGDGKDIEICLVHLDTEKEAKTYIDYLGRQSKVVFETEV